MISVGTPLIIEILCEYTSIAFEQNEINLCCDKKRWLKADKQHESLS